MKRREFLARSSLLVGGIPFAAGVSTGFAGPASSAGRAEAKQPAPQISFETSDTRYQATYSHALEVLARNTTLVSGYALPVLIEGSNYSGIWLECAPQEGLAYSVIRSDVARNNHLAFFALQREDGQIPCWSRTTAIGFGQIQMVVPIAATAWELSRATGDSELLERAYSGCGRWDAWLRRYRDTRQTGLCEGFCTYDTGHDNSPRWEGMPNRCPDADARKCPPVPSLPRLCPDLSATVHGGRIALAAMARALGKDSEADRWLADAETIRSAIVRRLYVADDGAFYDVDAQDRFVRIRGDVISRVLGEHVVDQAAFETIYERQIHKATAFWAPYPLPSIAMDDPRFVRPIPRNSWGGASQALTALRAPRWMEHYRKPADLADLMRRWVDAINRDGRFLQQMDPVTGTFNDDTGDYSPAALVFIDFTWRLSGVRRTDNGLEWNVRPPTQGTSRFQLRVSPTMTAAVKYAAGQGELYLNDKLLFRATATVRLITDLNGKLETIVGTDSTPVKAVLRDAGGRELAVEVRANEMGRVGQAGRVRQVGG